MKIDDMENAEAVQNEIKNLGYTPNWNAEWVKSQQKQFQSIQLVLGCIGAVSLFVAAIGIANTMMMSIYERTKRDWNYQGTGMQSRKYPYAVPCGSFIYRISGWDGRSGPELSDLLGAKPFWGGHPEVYDGEFQCKYFLYSGLACRTRVDFCHMCRIVASFPALRATQLSPLAAIRNE